VSDAPLISVVDDDDSIRESLRGLFRSFGFGVKVYASAEDFLTENASNLCSSDCLILDFRMPGMNGIELQQRLTANFCSVPIIFITAHGDESARSRVLKQGAVDFLLKPFSEEELLNAVQTALNWKARTGKDNQSGET
jgi:FixJ family two-component response regulator